MRAEEDEQRYEHQSIPRLLDDGCYLHIFNDAPRSISSTRSSKVPPWWAQALGTSEVSVMPGEVLMSITMGTSLSRSISILAHPERSKAS